MLTCYTCINKLTPCCPFYKSRRIHSSYQPPDSCHSWKYDYYAEEKFNVYRYPWLGDPCYTTKWDDVVTLKEKYGLIRRQNGDILLIKKASDYWWLLTNDTDFTELKELL